MIKIGNQEYLLKYTVRALFVYEQITGTSFSPDKLLNEYTLLYAILIANNTNFSLTFEELIELCDQDQSIFIEFRKWFLNVLKQKCLLHDESEKQLEDDKKKD
ncbi:MULTISPECIES: hypothetical protein [Parabacteroides]|jgi:hypothetical protein|uniref:Tail assembly chaperone protein n=1 Tax=Siphoviridae sp. ct7aK2 TaxID=2825351 RepID=A0A8S5U9C0_9CAUD|nr:hypothetical protein [Parabacteroides goldsteinii]DAF91071.1 MAG TPA: tail assembly chaperone protein [Siphoviridae sp. ct7aK2]